MKLYVCWTSKTMPLHEHPCGIAHEALAEAGYDPEIVHARGWTKLPDALNNSSGRQEVRERSGGNDEVPALVTDSDEFIQGTREIIEWAKAHPANSPVAGG
ncbi:MAG: hypothetical protein ACR2K6_03555 [Solirubrobacterales bacterium]|jgi:hypothetical protein